MKVIILLCLVILAVQGAPQEEPEKDPQCTCYSPDFPNLCYCDINGFQVHWLKINQIILMIFKALKKIINFSNCFWQVCCPGYAYCCENGRNCCVKKEHPMLRFFPTGKVTPKIEVVNNWINSNFWNQNPAFQCIFNWVLWIEITLWKVPSNFLKDIIEETEDIRKSCFCIM